MLVPRASGRKYPAIILLGGKATGKYAIDYVPEIQGVIVVAVDYPYEPRESYTFMEFVGDVPAIRRALMAMIPSVMLLTDYLLQRPDVDSAKIVLLGYSFGAPFVPCIVAHDKRSAAAAMVYGGGEMYSLIEHNVRRYESAVASKFVGMLGGFLLWPVEPVRYAERISPVPLIMINGSHDEMIPRENVEMVYEKAGEPKKLIWLESGHVRPDKVDLTRTIVETLRTELVGLGVLP
jgi:dienelactone hydrolase